MKMEILLEPTSNKLLVGDMIKLWWKWRYLVPVESIHSPILTLNVFNQRHHDNRKTYNTASATLISNVMIKKSVSMRSKVTTVSIKISTAGTYYCLCSVSAAGYKDTIFGIYPKLLTLHQAKEDKISFKDHQSPVVVKYDQHAYFVTSHWGPKRQSFYGYASNLTSSKDVYSRRRIIAVTRLTIMKKLCLQDIEDMLLLLIQQKLINLTIDERYDLNVALCMFTRRIVIQRWVEDLQLGVKSYQKKLNLTKPDTYRPNLRNKTAYTFHSDPHGIIYVDQFKRKRMMRTDELHKFSDGTLNDLRTALHDIAARIRMEYLPMMK
ncbi:hypothetical protein Tco_1321517 [Tanacetum coccineum]